MDKLGLAFYFYKESQGSLIFWRDIHFFERIMEQSDFLVFDQVLVKPPVLIFQDIEFELLEVGDRWLALHLVSNS